jgi:hypothetical protein
MGGVCKACKKNEKCLQYRAIAQAVSRWLPTAAITGQVMWDLWWTKWHWGRFSLSTSISPANPQSTNCSIIIIRGWYNRPTVADVPSGLSLTPPRETKKNACNVFLRKLERKIILGGLRIKSKPPVQLLQCSFTLHRFVQLSKLL